MAITSGTSVSMGNTPQAGDDSFLSSSTGITEDSTGNFILDVMANDLGGKAKSLYSIDNGAEIGDASAYSDLLAKDAVNSIQYSKLGAEIKITAEGKISYHITPGMNLQSLGQGQSVTDTFTYAIQLGNGTLSWATASVQIMGVNDAPTVTALTASAVEGDGTVSVNGLTGAADVDNGTTLSVVQTAVLPAGVTIAGNVVSLDANDAAYDNLAQGETKVVTVTYGVSDGIATTPNTVTFTITGTNDAPTVTAQTGSVDEGASASVDGLAGAADVDNGAVLSVVETDALPAGVSISGSTITLDASNAAYDNLAQGETATVTVNYGVSDGIETTANTATFTVTGTNDAPTVTALTGAVSEGGSTSVNGLNGTDDVDNGATLSVVATDALPAGASISGDSITLDASNAAYDHLAEGVTQEVTVNYGVTDGIATTANTVTFTVTGVNDAAVITGDAAGSVAEDGVTVASGTLAVNDADDGQSTFAAASGSTAYGSYSIDAAGNWSYEANNALAAIQDLNDGQTLADSFTVYSADGTSQVVSLTINGANEPVTTTPLPPAPTTDSNNNDTTGTGGTSANNTFNGIDAGPGANETYNGLGGNDTIDGNGGNDNLYGGTGNDTIFGDAGVDAIYGGSGDDTIYGGTGVDALYGGSGNDVIVGNENNDTITGGLGQDTMTGSANNDTFVFGNIYDSAVGAADTITDFNVAGTDKIDLSAIDADISDADNDAFVFGGNLTAVESGSNTIISADVNGDATADMQIVLTGTGLGLDAGDFVL